MIFLHESSANGPLSRANDIGDVQMAGENRDRLRHYLELITARKGGVESVIPDLEGLTQVSREAEVGGFEVLRHGPSAAEIATRSIKEITLGRNLGPEEESGLEAIINAEIRPAIDVVDGTFISTHPLWTHLSADASIKARIEAILPSIGRLELPGNPKLPYGGTGFVVGDGLIMTNRHVAAIFAQGVGDRNLSFTPGNRAGIDFLRERDRPTGPTLMVRRVVMIHPYWDMALLSVDGLPAGQKPLKLALTDARDLVGTEICVVGYPAFDPRNPHGEQNDLFGGRYGVKRLQPGELQGATDTASFGKLVSAASHDCSTLGGNSGSAVVDLKTGEVLALHFGGRYHERNYAVPSVALAHDGRVVDAGVQFVGTPPGGQDALSQPWWQRADSGESPTAEPSGADQAPAPSVAPVPPSSAGVASPSDAAGAMEEGTVVFEIPLRIAISIGRPIAPMRVATQSPSVEATAAEPAEEALREPFHDTDYDTRRGYDPRFLNGPDSNSGQPSLVVPIPGPKDQSVLAQTRDGGHELRYQNFSVFMHRDRRLALVCASNVTADPKLKKPESGYDYSRKGLSGLGRNDQERWFPDPRLESSFQLPDAFFTKDRKAFDKGHIVRREDVAWGASYDMVRRANGDTFHVTNCSPQVSGFNQSQAGEDNWGDLENYVLSEAASERLCVFAGAVLDPADEVFVGAGDGGALIRAKIPKRYWKVLVARDQDGLAAYGFVLEQDLSAVDWELAVPAEFSPSMCPLSGIAEMTGLTFDPAVLAADQYITVRGAELALRSGVPRRRRDR